MSVKYEINFSAPPFDAPKARKLTLDAFEIATRTATIDIHGEVVQRTPGSGILQNSILPNTEVAADYIKGSVSSSALYAPFVEFGTRARRGGNWPPYGPINLWVRRKFGITDKKEADRVTFFIRRKIVREGTSSPRFTGTNSKGYWMFKLGLSAARDRVETLFAKTLVIVVEKIARF